MLPKHPELKEGERFLRNVCEHDIDDLFDVKTKHPKVRFGKKAVDSRGERLYGFIPAFIPE